MDYSFLFLCRSCDFFCCGKMNIWISFRVNLFNREQGISINQIFSLPRVCCSVFVSNGCFLMSFWACVFPWAYVALSKLSLICSCFWISCTKYSKGKEGKNEGKQFWCCLNEGTVSLSTLEATSASVGHNNREPSCAWTSIVRSNNQGSKQFPDIWRTRLLSSPGSCKSFASHSRSFEVWFIFLLWGSEFLYLNLWKKNTTGGKKSLCSFYLYNVFHQVSFSPHLLIPIFYMCWNQERK